MNSIWCVCVCVFVNSFGYSEEEKRPVFLHRMNRKLGNFYLITNKRTNKFFFISHHYYSCRKFLFSNYKQTNNLSFHFNYSQSENEKKDLKTIRFFSLRRRDLYLPVVVVVVVISCCCKLLLFLHKKKLSRSATTTTTIDNRQ